MVAPHTLTAQVGEGGKIEFVLPDAKPGDFVSLTVEPRSVKHPERFGFAPGFVISIGPDFDKSYEPES